MNSYPRLRDVSCLDAHGLHRVAYWEWGEPGWPDVVVCDLHLADGAGGPAVIVAIERAMGVRPPALIVSAGLIEVLRR